VSLLMDALRKAEEQKSKQGADARDGLQADLSLEPLQGQAEPVVGSLPELPTSLEALDGQFAVHATPPRPAPAFATPAPGPADAERAGARKLFDAKQPPASDNRSFALTAGLLGLASAVAIGAYFWWQLQPKGGLGAIPLAAPPPASAPVLPVAPLTALPAAPVAIPAIPPAPAPILTVGQDEAEESPTAPPPRRVAASPAVAPAPAAPPASPEQPTLRLTARTSKPDPLPEQAWQAFNAGEHALARLAWEKLLENDPRNADALHGLAALALLRQQGAQAHEYYLRALEANPKDGRALAGLAALRPPADAVQAESRLKSLLAEQPNSPDLNFALGNLLAREARWAEAQQVFFRAHAAEPNNPDYLFNLAVSLDQLRQPRLAAEYYNRALAAAASHPAGFDATQTQERLRSLQAQ